MTPASAIPEICDWGPKNGLGDMTIDHTPFVEVLSSIGWELCTKYEISTFTNYEDTKDDTKWGD